MAETSRFGASTRFPPVGPRVVCDYSCKPSIMDANTEATLRDQVPVLRKLLVVCSAEHVLLSTAPAIVIPHKDDHRRSVAY